jgi:hypothetical protein
MKSEFGIQRIDSNYLEFKYLAFNVFQWALHMMERVSFQVGQMAKSEPSSHNLENYFM